MTTLPPEGADGQEAGGQPTNGSPVPPVVPPAPPAPPQAPAAPPAPQYQAPPAPPQPHQAPPQAPQYQAPPPGGYQAPPPGYAPQPVADPVSNITLNYWLSVFFTWIPALIFFLIEKDKGNAHVRAYHADNLNFSLMRVGIWVVIYVLGWIPYIGWLIGLVLWLGAVVLFVFHIIAAVKAPDSFRRGEKPPFIFNIPMVK